MEENTQDGEYYIKIHVPSTTSDTWTFVETTNVVQSNAESDPVSFTDSLTATLMKIQSESDPANIVQNSVESGIDHRIKITDYISII